MPDRATFVTAFAAAERLIEERYGIPVVVSDVPTPFTGDLDGAEIRVDYDLDPEDALFIIVHLFGHTVQWNVSPEARAIARHYGRIDHLESGTRRAYDGHAWLDARNSAQIDGLMRYLYGELGLASRVRFVGRALAA